MSEKGPQNEDVVVFHAPPPMLSKLDEEAIRLDNELDELYKEKQVDKTKHTASEWEEKENQIISKMVDRFIVLGDAKLRHESVTRASGSIQ
jgi:hypothetical protein